MKYLKRFNEKLTVVEMDEIKDFCESHLAYLLDKGFKINVSTIQRDSDRDSRYALSATLNPTRKYRIYKIDIIASAISTWNDIKDHFIPFMELMMSELNINFKGIVFKGTSHYSFETSPISVIQDRFTEEMSGVDGIGKDLKITKISIELLDKELEDSVII